MANCVVQVRLEEDLKQKADEIFANLGLDTPTAVRIFLAQAVKSHGIPFDVRQKPAINADTLTAMAEIEKHIKNKKGKTFKSVDDLFKDLES